MLASMRGPDDGQARHAGTESQRAHRQDEAGPRGARGLLAATTTAGRLEGVGGPASRRDVELDFLPRQGWRARGFLRRWNVSSVKPVPVVEAVQGTPTERPCPECGGLLVATFAREDDGKLRTMQSHYTFGEGRRICAGTLLVRVKWIATPAR